MTQEKPTKDELLKTLFDYERINRMSREHVSDELWNDISEKNKRAIEILKSEYSLDNQGIRIALGDWEERTFRKEYDESFCSHCPSSLGYERFKELKGVLECVIDKVVTKTIGLPKTKQECTYRLEYILEHKK